MVIVGTGAAGVAVAELLHDARVGQDGTGDIIGVDSTGILHRERENLTPTKQWFVEQRQLRRSAWRCPRGAAGRRRAARALRPRHHPARVARRDGRRRDRVRDGEPDPRGDARADARQRVGDRHRSQRLPEPDQQRAGVPRRVPWSARRAGHSLHDRDQARRCRRARRARDRPGRRAGHPRRLRARRGRRRRGCGAGHGARSRASSAADRVVVPRDLGSGNHVPDRTNRRGIGQGREMSTVRGVLRVAPEPRLPQAVVGGHVLVHVGADAVPAARRAGLGPHRT